MRYSWIALLLFVLAACSSQQPAISTAPPLPTASLPTVQGGGTPPTHAPATATLVSAPSTPVASPGPTVVQTSTSVPLATALPILDSRVILENPNQFLLEVKDLPAEGLYYVPNTGALGTLRNATILSIWGQERGGAFLESTGRIEGWWVLLTRGSQGVRAPERVYNSVTRFETAEGARLAVLEYNAALTPWIQEGWVLVSPPPDIGDASVLLNRKDLQINGKNLEWVRIEFAYHNMAVVVEARDWEGTVPPEFVDAALRRVLAKLEAAPLQAPSVP